MSDQDIITGAHGERYRVESINYEMGGKPVSVQRHAPIVDDRPTAYEEKLAELTARDGEACAAMIVETSLELRAPLDRARTILVETSDEYRTALAAHVAELRERARQRAEAAAAAAVNSEAIQARARIKTRIHTTKMRLEQVQAEKLKISKLTNGKRTTSKRLDEQEAQLRERLARAEAAHAALSEAA